MPEPSTPSLLTDREVAMSLLEQRVRYCHRCWDRKVAATLLEQHWQRIAYCHRCGCWRPRSDFRPPSRVCRPCRTAEQALSRGWRQAA